MSELLPIIFSPLAVLIGYPYLALIPAIFLGIVYFKLKKNIVGITALLWIIYSVYETLNLLRITCSGECNIRVDLILIFPFLTILTLISLFQIIRAAFVKRLR